MKFIIDTDHELSPDLQYLLHLYNLKEIKKADEFEARNSPDSIPIKSYRQYLIDKKYISSNNVVNKIKLLRSKSINEFIDDIIPEFREKFKGKKTGSMGDINSVKKKMEKFFEINSDYIDKELILSATERYINSCARDNYKFLMQADYFIYKNKNDGGGITSTLASYCEEVVSLPKENNTRFF